VTTASGVGAMNWDKELAGGRAGCRTRSSPDLWRSVGISSTPLPEGWKIHLSCDYRDFSRVVAASVPAIRRWPYKLARDARTAGRLNAGRHGELGRGKVVTIYVGNEVAFAELVEELEERVTVPAGPLAVRDARRRVGSPVSWRYGGSLAHPVQDDLGRVWPSVRAPWGGFVPDCLSTFRTHPSWVSPPWALVHQEDEDVVMLDWAAAQAGISTECSQVLRRGTRWVARAQWNSAPCVVKWSTERMNGLRGVELLAHETDATLMLSALGHAPSVLSSRILDGGAYLVVEDVGVPLSEAPVPLGEREVARVGRALRALFNDCLKQGFALDDLTVDNVVFRAGRLVCVDLESCRPARDAEDEWRSAERGIERILNYCRVGVGAALGEYAGGVPAARTAPGDVKGLGHRGPKRTRPRRPWEASDALRARASATVKGIARALKAEALAGTGPERWPSASRGGRGTWRDVFDGDPGVAWALLQVGVRDAECGEVGLAAMRSICSVTGATSRSGCYIGEGGRALVAMKYGLADGETRLIEAATDIAALGSGSGRGMGLLSGLAGAAVADLHLAEATAEPSLRARLKTVASTLRATVAAHLRQMEQAEPSRWRGTTYGTGVWGALDVLREDCEATSRSDHGPASLAIRALERSDRRGGCNGAAGIAQYLLQMGRLPTAAVPALCVAGKSARRPTLTAGLCHGLAGELALALRLRSAELVDDSVVDWFVWRTLGCVGEGPFGMSVVGDAGVPCAGLMTGSAGVAMVLLAYLENRPMAWFHERPLSLATSPTVSSARSQLVRAPAK